MVKLLIVDDEPGICELLYKLIEWEKLGIRSLGFAQNGLEAWQMIQIHRPDIVVTDIQMPGITGLTLIERAKQAKLDTSFIVISGYREFKFAQRAIKAGVEDYLLKPIQKEDLNLVLKRLIQKRQSAVVQAENMQSMYAELMQKNAILRKSELQKMWSEPEYLLRDDFFQFEEGCFLGVGVHAAISGQEEVNFDLLANVLENIGVRMVRLLEEECFDLEFVVDENHLLLLMNYSEEQHAQYIERRNMLQNLLKEMRIQYNNLQITFGIGEIVESVTDISRTVTTVKDALHFRLMWGSKRLLEYRKLEEIPREPKCEFSDVELQTLIKYVTSFHAEEAVTLVESVYRRFREIDSYDICNLFETTYSIIMRLRHEIVFVGMRGPKCEEIPGVPAPPSEKTVYVCVNNCGSILELRTILVSYIQQECAYCLAVQQQKICEPIRIAQDYIQKNIHRQISLEEVASRACISAGYLSTLFKEKTGEGFSDYIIRMRMDKARELLCSSNQTIAEIAEAVGYADYRHFSKVFQKIMGVKPTVYRKFYR